MKKKASNFMQKPKFIILLNLFIELIFFHVSSICKNYLTCVSFTCGNNQIIWDEVGETDADRDKMLLELEQECLEVYRRKVDQANRCRAQLRQTIADSEAELAAICSAMGERPVHIRQVRNDSMISTGSDNLNHVQ